MNSIKFFEFNQKIRNVEVKIRQIIWSFKTSFKPTTGDEVEYKDGYFFIKPTFTGDNIWHLYRDYKGTPNYSFIKGNDLKVKFSFERFKRLFLNNLNFQENYWGIIDRNKPIGERLSYDNSDDIVF